MLQHQGKDCGKLDRVEQDIEHPGSAGEFAYMCFVAYGRFIDFA